MKPSFILLLLAALTLPGAIAEQTEDAATINQLVRQTQELFDAIVPGNPEPWKRYYAEDCIFADEKGRVLDKAALVADITPLPSGYSGVIKIVNVKSRLVGDAAILNYDANETETIFGQELHARYHTIDTWLRRNGNWQIIASQTHRYYEDPAVGESDPAKFGTFAGTYELAPGQTRIVRVEDGKLFTERKGKKEQLLPETPDIFFRKGIEGRILFSHDKKTGRVSSLIDRRNNEDVIWHKVK